MILNSIRGSLIAKAIIITALVYLIVIFVLPRWDKVKIESRDFSRKLMLDSVVTALNNFQITNQRYPQQLNESGCFTKENLEESFVKSIPAENFPADPVRETTFEGNCAGQLLYFDLSEGKAKQQGKGFLLAINSEGDALIRTQAQTEGFACWPALKAAKKTIEAMKEALADKSCFNSFSTDDIVMAVVKSS